MDQHRNSTRGGILTIIAAMVMAMMSGCSIEDWDYTWNHHGIGTGYNGSLQFELIAQKTDMEPRSGHASAVFKDALWIFGGYNPNARGDRSSYLSDVWYSRDGRTWTAVTHSAPWAGRRGHKVLVYKDSLYLVGGYRVRVENGISYGGAVNDVWKSSDGITWEEIKPYSYKTRITHPSLPAEEDVRGTDVYDPADDRDWYPRLNHGAAVLDPDGTGPEPELLYIFGGFAKERMPYLNDGDVDETRKYFADSWSSPDGITWTQREPMSLGDGSAEIYGRYRAGRASGAHFVDGGALYVVGGTSWFNFQDTGAGFVVPDWDRIWKRSGGTWTVTGPRDSEFIERRGHSIVKYNDAFWILPGSKPGALQWYGGADSIWKLTMNEEGGIASASRDGDYRTGSPMYGIAEYTAEAFTPQEGPDAGIRAIYVLCGDGDGGVRNTTWRIIAKDGGTP